MEGEDHSIQQYDDSIDFGNVRNDDLGFHDLNEDKPETVQEEGDINVDPALQNADSKYVSEAIDEEALSTIPSYKIGDENAKKEVSVKKNIRKAHKASPAENEPGDKFVPLKAESEGLEMDYNNEDPSTRRRRLLEEKMDMAVKAKTSRRRRADEDDLERMQDDKIDMLKDKMIKAANLDVEKNSEGQIATEKSKLLKEVVDVLSKADLAISILDNNLLEAVRLWLEPLPDASMPAYQIQKELINALATLPIKTDHLVASGIGKVLVFYQRSKRTEPNLRKIVDNLIGDWTRPILNRSDSYKDRTIQFHEYNKSSFANQLSSARRQRPKEAKTLYEESAQRRKRAAIPTARTTAYKIAPKVDTESLRRQAYRNSSSNDERFRRLNQKLTSMSVKKKANKKSGPSIEGRNLAI